MEIDTSGTFYRAKKDSFMWKAGAILELDVDLGEEGGYNPLNGLRAWDATKFNVLEGEEDDTDEYISARIIQNNPDWFERVYPVKKTKTEGDIAFANSEEITQKYNLEFESIEIQSDKVSTNF